VTSSRSETLLLTYCQLVPSLRRTHTHSWRYGSEVVAGWRRIAILFHRGVLGRAGKSEAVAMDVKWLLGRADESVVTVSSGRGLLCSDIHSIPTNKKNLHNTTRHKLIHHCVIP